MKTRWLVLKLVAIVAAAGLVAWGWRWRYRRNVRLEVREVLK